MSSTQPMLFLAIDADNAGRLVGRAVLADDVAGLADISSRIDSGQELVENWAIDNGGSKISGGGDELTLTVPPEALQNIEILRADYAHLIGLTITVGVGSKLSEAGKSLMAGKFRGKNQVVVYDPSVDQELQAAVDNVQAGSGTDEEKKITDAYLQAPPAAAPTPGQHNEADCKYCQESAGHEHSAENCDYCAAHEAKKDAEGVHDHTDDCQYCAAAESPLAESEDGHDASTCEYCMAHDAKTEGHDASTCEYCMAHDQKVNSGAHEDNCQYCNHYNSQSATQGAQQINSMISTDDPNTQTERDQVEGIDATQMPTGGPVLDGVSRPDGYTEEQSPGTMGMAEEDSAEPNLTDVLRGGLDEHAQEIQREKIGQMIGQALEGFKASKGILEKAKEQAPQFYQASIQMLKAMLEMGKMLGMGSQEEAPPEAAPQAQPAAAQGDAAQSPQR